jgi:PAS domain-containing protein
MSRTLEQLFQQMNAEHARLEAVLEAATDGVLALAADTSVRYANSAAGTILGTTSAGMLGRPLIESARDYELDALARRVETAADAFADLSDAVPAFGGLTYADLGTRGATAQAAAGAKGA